MRFQIGSVSLGLFENAVEVGFEIAGTKIHARFVPATERVPSNHLSLRIGDALFNTEFDIPDNKPKMYDTRWNAEKGCNERYYGMDKGWQIDREVG